MKCDYKTRKLDISMPGYVKDTLHKFQHPNPTRPQHSFHQWTEPKYESTAPQMAQPSDDYLTLNPDEANTVQQVFGKFLYYAHTVGPTMLAALNAIAAQQSKSTQETAKKGVQLLNYAASQPGAITRYHASGTTLHMHRNTSFFISTRGENKSRGVSLPQ